MKQRSVILCSICLLGIITGFAISYIGGRNGMPLMFLVLPADFIPILIVLFCLFILFVNCCSALWKKSHRTWPVSMFLISVLAFILSRIILPAEIFQIGFRDRITSTITIEELRNIAKIVHQTIGEEESLPGPRKPGLWDEKLHREKWNELESTTAVKKLDPSLVIYKNSRSVSLTWGGALVGHWGVKIQLPDSGKENMEDGDIAPDIQTFCGPN